MNAPAKIRVTSLYQFASFPDPAALRGPLADACAAAGLKGTLLLAHEGINGTIAGPDAGIEAVLSVIRALPGCAGLDVKNDFVEAMPFHRMKVRLKAEIVTLGVDGIDPTRDVGTYVEPADWNALIAEPGTILIDTRNDYEVDIGTFPGAINPRTSSFRDFPAWFRAQRAALVDGAAAPKVAMFCTGGIRCEKATAFLKAEGIADVHHLKGGILRYLETVPAAESVWEGECFVFDQRVAVGQGLAPGTHALCHACRRPVSPEAQTSPLYEPGVRCPACANERQDDQRCRYAERQRQVELATERGEAHLGESRGSNGRRLSCPGAGPLFE
ncbi:rhodanese-related sulfurtransferase [Beijerinckia sp. L45]|uniref:oxygen-dependent tRNA uridine(34) hydroxylase TrhO n=1 Tax=Beijerinckia sp. L45 TaxID=1641855 RepID=UPI00131A8560|nr:rhodanese-related sulfurtransferase [Beijerinckia sp. L45]